MDELKDDPHVNLGFYSNGSWVSISGFARVEDDCRKDDVERVSQGMDLKQYFKDLGDGIHTGTASDPRISIIHIEPITVHYAIAPSAPVQFFQMAKSALKGEHAPASETQGTVREVSGEELGMRERDEQLKSLGVGTGQTGYAGTPGYGSGKTNITGMGSTMGTVPGQSTGMGGMTGMGQSTTGIGQNTTGTGYSTSQMGQQTQGQGTTGSRIGTHHNSGMVR